jgi:ribulose-phosphate 3-epimerase
MGFTLKVSPSLLAADYAHLGDAAVKAEEGGASSLHLDYMDGHYVANISFSFELIPALKKRVFIPLIAHLMISNTEERVEDFIKLNPDFIIIQEDTVKNLEYTLKKIKKSGIKTGFAINPDIPLKKVHDELFLIDCLLILSVFPGFGGQKFIDSTLTKMEEAHEFRVNNNLLYDIAVDGGVNMDTAKKIVKAGANVLIAGTGIYGTGDLKKAIQDFLDLG